MEDEIKKLKERLGAEAEKCGIVFKQDEKSVESVLKSLLKRKETLGDFYCPCRVFQKGKPEENKKIVCICEFVRKGEPCICGLFERKGE